MVEEGSEVVASEEGCLEDVDMGQEEAPEEDLEDQACVALEEDSEVQEVEVNTEEEEDTEDHQMEDIEDHQMVDTEVATEAATEEMAAIEEMADMEVKADIEQEAAEAAEVEEEDLEAASEAEIIMITAMIMKNNTTITTVMIATTKAMVGKSY